MSEYRPGKEFQEFLKEELQKAFDAGVAHERKRFMAALKPTDDASYAVAPHRRAKPKKKKTAPRAERGAVKAVVLKVMDSKPGLTTAEFEKAAVAADPSVSERSVNNELYRGRRDGDFVRVAGKWSLSGKCQRTDDMFKQPSTNGHTNGMAQSEVRLHS